MLYFFGTFKKSHAKYHAKEIQAIRTFPRLYFTFLKLIRRHFAFVLFFYFGNIDPQARSTKQNKTVQKQVEVLVLNEEFLTEALSGENKKKFLVFVNAWV